MTIIKLLPAGRSRVLDGETGMTFVVDSFTDTYDNRGKVAHVRDYRHFKNCATLGRPFQIWSIGPGGYEMIEN